MTGKETDVPHRDDPSDIGWLVQQSEAARNAATFIRSLLTHLSAAMDVELAALLLNDGPEAGVVHYASDHGINPLELAGLRGRIEGLAEANGGDDAFIHRFTRRNVAGSIYLEPLDADRHQEAVVRIEASLALLDLIGALEMAREEASRDPLTGLANRRSLADALGTAIEQGNRYGTTFALAMIDMNNFKWFNDTFGHAEGDKLLAEVARVLSSRVRRADLVARYGGDEFLLLLPHTDPERADLVFRRVATELDDFLQRYENKGHGAKLGFSYGLSSFPDDGRDADTLIRRADERLYQAKEEAGLEPRTKRAKSGS